MKNKILLVAYLVLTLIACNNDDDQGVLSDEKKITAFSFESEDNETIKEDIKANIDEAAKTITAQVPFGTDVKSLKPKITLSKKAKVSPKDMTAVDFSTAVDYIVTAEDGSTQKYKVSVAVNKSTEKEIIGFKFLASENEGLWKDIDAVLNEDEKTLTAEVPSSTNLTALKPTIIFSEGATISLKQKVAMDFSAEVTFTVTAEDGGTATYKITVNQVALTDRDRLEILYYDNPNNTLNWNLKDDNISSWEGVNVTNDRVTELDIENKGLTVLHSSIGDLVNLKNLNLSSNAITVLPAEISNLENLENLNLENNSITKIPTQISNFTKLKSLDVRDNSLTALPAEIGDLVALNELYISFNSLTSLPAEIGNLTKLRILRSRENSLTSLPKEIGNLSNLEILDVYKNSILNLPEEIVNLTNLETLSLSENSLTDLPSGIGNLTKLKTLSLGDNSLSTIPAGILDNLTDLTFLRLSDNSLTNIPSEIDNLVNLETLFLQGNALTELIPEIGNLKNLQILNVSNNSLTELPTEIGDVEKLEELLLFKNSLTNLPLEISNLGNLRILNIIQNEITSIPKEICDMEDNGLNLARDQNAQCES